ncbi:MAG: ubiquinone/menaquinone biosynthesis methyltransferase [Alphaproteobacteria bacterium]|nr:ubiquinone/menaquinone biosynthesis methyltransferase [Alphaproteobacteria bacterium]
MRKETFFGLQKVDQNTKERLVDSLFSKVSDKYDLMNDLMSLGIHRLWKDEFCKERIKYDEPILDMAGGTGDISLKLYKSSIGLGSVPTSQIGEGLDSQKTQIPRITLCDLNIDMIEKSRRKHYDSNILNIKYVCAPAERLPFPSEVFGSYVVAFGVRNFANIEEGLKEAERVLKPGGRFLCLEFSKVSNPILSSLYQAYSKYVIPNLGSLLGDRDSYQYLVDSIEKFYSAEEFLSLVENAGFGCASYRTLSGGVVAIHSAYKK